MANRRRLVDASAFEAQVGADPEDLRRWTALEDFLIAHDDPRGEVAIAERKRSAPAVIKARSAAMSSLFGPKHATIVGRFQRAVWRGAYLVEVDYFYRSENDRLEAAVLELLLASPASALIGRLMFGHGAHNARMVKTLAGLPDRPLAQALRTLELADEEPHAAAHQIDLAPFARLPMLEQLSIGARLRRPKFRPELGARLVRFGVAPQGAAAIRTLFPTAGYPRLRDLTIELTGSGDEPVLSGRATPSLEILRISGDADREGIVDALATSALLPQLRELHLEPSAHGWQRWTTCAPAKLGRAFKHLKRVVVRKGSIWTR